MEATQVLELTQALETSQSEENSDLAVKVGSLAVNGVDHDIFNKENTIGRDESCDVVINSKAVSVEHAIIEADAFGKHLIWDLGSTNKTRLGEVQLKPRVRHYLSDGARLRFANVNAVYHHIKVVLPQRPLLSEPVVQIPGTPERIDEDAAAIASIVEESPRKNDNDSDGDFFGENDSSALFMRPLVGDRCASTGDERSLSKNPANEPSPIDSETPAPSAGLLPQLNPPSVQAINESSLCEAGTSDVANGEGDLSDVIAGSQPMFTPQKAVNIYEADMVPYRVEETPVKASKNDEMNWEDIDDTVSQISQEMDTIDTLIENKELCVAFTPTKRIADSTSVENDDAPSAAAIPESSSKPSPANRNLASRFGDPPLGNEPQLLSPYSSPKKSCVEQLHDDKMNIYDLQTEPLAAIGAKMGTNGNIFDMATQEGRGLEEENIRLEAGTSVYDVATQQFATESKKTANDPVLCDTDDPGPGLENAADISMSDLPTQAAGGLGGLSPVLASDAPKGLVPPSVKSAVKESVTEADVSVRNGENPVDSSMCDMLTQAADVNTTDSRVSESHVKSNEIDAFNVSISDMATQLVNGRNQLPPQDARGTRGESLINADMPRLIDDTKRRRLSGLCDVSLSDMLTQPTENKSSVTVAKLCNVLTQVSPVADVSLADLETQMVADSSSIQPAGSCTDGSVSDLQTQGAVEPAKIKPEELNAADVGVCADVSISDLQTQIACMPHNEILNARSDGVNALENLSHFANPPSKKKDGAAELDSEDIYNVMTQMPVADHQIMCEDSNTEQIELELDRYEKRSLDSVLGKSSDGSSDNVADCTSPFKTPTLKVKASPKTSSSDTHIDVVYLLDTQPLHTPVMSRNADRGTQGFKASDVEVSEDTINEKHSATKKLVSEQAEISIHDVETQAFDETNERSKPAETSIYDVETQGIEKAEVPSKPDETPIYEIETQDFSTAEEVGIVDVSDVPLAEAAESLSRPSMAETPADKNSTEVCKNEKSVTRIASAPPKHRSSQDLDANSVENRIRAMTDTNVNTPLIHREPSGTKSTVAELLETLEGTPIVPGGVTQRPAEAGVSQNSNTHIDADTGASQNCSQFPVKKPRKKVKELVYTDSEDSYESGSRCSQFPVEKVHKRANVLAYSDSEDSSESPSLAQKRNKKPLDNERAIDPAKEDDKTVIDASPGSLCNGNSSVSKEETNVSLVAKESGVSKTEPATVPADAAIASETNFINDTSGSESLRLHLSDVSTLVDDSIRDIDTPGKSNAVDKLEKSETNPSTKVTPARPSDLGGASKELSASFPEHREPKSHVGTPANVIRPNTSPETPEIPKDFFGTPVIHEKPPLRQYVNKKKLSLNASSLLKGPNASSTPISDKESHSVIDMEETLLTTNRKTYGKTTAGSVGHCDDSSQSDQPKNVKKFRKSPVKRLSKGFQLFSQDSETLDSQDELMDSQELGRGKRKRVKKNFFGFGDGDDDAPPTAVSPMPQLSTTGTNVATGSKVGEESTAQPSVDISPVLNESPEAEAPRRERPRKQAFMSCESNEARNTMERYRNDACYVKSPPKVDAPSNVIETVAEVHEKPAKPVKSSNVEMDLARMKDSLRASMSRGFADHKSGQESPESKSPVKPAAGAPSESLKSDGSYNLSPARRGRGRPPTKNTTQMPSNEVPASDVRGVDVPKPPVRPGRGRKREVGASTEGGLNSQEIDIQPGKPDPPSGKPSTSSTPAVCSEGETSKKMPSDLQTRTQDLNRVPKSPTLPSRSRRRKENAMKPSSSRDEGVPSLAARPDDGYVSVGERNRRVQRCKDLPGSQDSQAESQESQSSVFSGHSVRTRGSGNNQLSSQESILPEKVAERPPSRRRIRKLSARSKNLESQHDVDDNYHKKPTSSDQARVTLETTQEPKALVAEKSVSPLKRGRPRKISDSSSPAPEKEPSSISSTASPLNISKRRPNQRGLKRKQDELSQDSQSEVSSTSSVRSTRKRGDVETTISVESSSQSANTSKKLKATNADGSKQWDGSGTGIQEGSSERLAYRRGAKQVVSEGTLHGSPSGSQSSSTVCVMGRRGNRNARKTPQLLDDSDLEVPIPDKVSGSEATSPRKTRGRPKKAAKKTADDALPAREESNVTEVGSSSKTRGRRKKNVEESSEGDNHLEPTPKEVSASEVPCSSRTRGRPKKAVEEAPGEDTSSQDLSQGRRSGRTRKKKESFDELVSRKEEEIRLKKLLRNAEQSPSPDKSHQLSVMTPSASVASVSDESAFSIPASPASSFTGKRSASRLGTSSTESLPSSSKRKKKEDLPSSIGQVKVMFTALGDKKLSAMIKKLGGKVVEKPTDCTVLVTDKVIRTVKFLCAFGLGIPIVSPNWVSKSKAFCQFTDPDESLLKDTEGEKKFEFELSSSLEKARSQKLFEGYAMFTTASILPPPKEMKPIIECSGGTFLAKPPAKWGPRSVIISDPKDKAEWPKLSRNGITPPILSAEAILTGILQQQFDMEKHRLK